MNTFLEPSNWIKRKNEKSSHLWKFPKSWQKKYTNQTKNYENTNTLSNIFHYKNPISHSIDCSMYYTLNTLDHFALDRIGVTKDCLTYIALFNVRSKETYIYFWIHCQFSQVDLTVQQECFV
jgi:hypothetical protein